MADQKISAMPNAATLTGTEVIPLVQSGANVKATLNTITDFVRVSYAAFADYTDREHRDLNVLRIGYVASEITRHRGIAVCCPIAPYDAVRKRVRAMIEPLGGFVLVHVATSLEECERRDRKGLYAKARAGLIPQFTGISDPYEAPADAAVTIHTEETPVEEAAGRVIDHLAREGYL